MVYVTLTDQFPWQLEDGAVLVPLDVGRWAVIAGGRPDLRRRVAADLRALSHRPSPFHLRQLRTQDAA